MCKMYICVRIYTYIHTPNLLILSVIARLLIIHIVLQWHQVVLCHLCACVGLHVCVCVCMYLPSEQKTKCVCTRLHQKLHVNLGSPPKQKGWETARHTPSSMDEYTHTYTNTRACIVCDVECTEAAQLRT